MKIWNKRGFHKNEEERLFVPNISQRFRLQSDSGRMGPGIGWAPRHDVSCCRLKRTKSATENLHQLRSALRVLGPCAPGVCRPLAVLPSSCTLRESTWQALGLGGRWRFLHLRPESGLGEWRQFGVWTQCSGHWLPYATWSFLWEEGEMWSNITEHNSTHGLEPRC